MKPVYLLLSDDPTARKQAQDRIRQEAVLAGFVEREVHYMEPGFDASLFFRSLHTASLFSTKTLIELSTPRLKVDDTLAGGLVYYLNHPSPDKILLLTAEKLAPRQKKTDWYRLINTTGSIITPPSHTKPITVFNLGNTIRRGNAHTALKTLRKLLETTDPVLILWGICHALRTPPHPDMRRLLAIAAEADLIIKGIVVGQARDILEALVLECCGKKMCVPHITPGYPHEPCP